MITVLVKAKERRSHQKELRRRGYDLERVAKRVAKICGIDVKAIFAKSPQQERVRARDSFCFWAVRELGLSLTDLARRLGMSPPGVGYAVRRGEAIAQKKRYRLAKMFTYLRASPEPIEEGQGQTRVKPLGEAQ